jgi:hypothetical protein
MKAHKNRNIYFYLIFSSAPTQEKSTNSTPKPMKGMGTIFGVDLVKEALV